MPNVSNLANYVLVGHGKGRCPNPPKEEADAGFGGDEGGFGGVDVG